MLDENKIEVKAHGSEISKVILSIRRLVSEELTVSIPASSLFVADSDIFQNMVARHTTTVNLDDDAWIELIIDAACANKARRVPTSSIGFTLQPPSSQPKLEILMDALEKAAVAYPIEQAAVWIVTDDADYDGLVVCGLSSATN